MLIFVKTIASMKKILFTLSIAAALLAGVSCKKDNNAPKYSEILGLWESVDPSDMSSQYIIMINTNEYVEKNIAGTTALDADEIKYQDSDIAKITSIEKEETDIVEGNVWKITFKEYESPVYVFGVDGETAKICWATLAPGGHNLLRRINTGVKFTYHYVPASAVDLGLSVYWATFDMIEPFPNLDPEKTFFNNWYNKNYVNMLFAFPDDEPVREALGRKWRMPSKAEWEELFAKCNFSLPYSQIGTDIQFINAISNEPGYENSFISLPLAGYVYNGNKYSIGHGAFWSSSNEGTGYYGTDIATNSQEMSQYAKSAQLTIRPVWDPNME